MTVPKQDNRVTRRAVAAFAIRVASAGLAYGSHVLFARWLSLEQYGLFAAAWTWILIAGGTLPLGFNVVVIGQLPRYIAAGDMAHARGLAVTALGLTGAFSVAAAVAAIGILAWRPGLVGNELVALAVMAVLCVPLLALGEVSEGLARGMGWIGSALVPAYVARPVLMLAGAAAVLAAGRNLDAATVVACAVLAAVATTVVQTAGIVVRLWRVTGRGALHLKPGTWVLLSLPMLVTEVSELLLASLDVLFVATFVGASEAGLYFAAQRSVALVAFVSFAVGAATGHSVAAAISDPARLAREVRTAATLSFWPTLAGALALVAAAPYLLALFGPRFAGGSTIVAILAVGFVARSVVGPAELLLSVIGASRACAAILVAHLAVGVTLNAMLVPAFGAVGAAVAATLTMVSLSISFATFAWLRLGIVLAPSVPWSHAARDALARR